MTKSGGRQEAAVAPAGANPWVAAAWLISRYCKKFKMKVSQRFVCCLICLIMCSLKAVASTLVKGLLVMIWKELRNIENIWFPFHRFQRNHKYFQLFCVPSLLCFLAGKMPQMAEFLLSASAMGPKYKTA